jgi:glutamine amidotransferase
MLHSLGVPTVVTSDAATLQKASKIVLPGVGAFAACMQNLDKSGLIPVLKDRVLGQQVPLLGICVGMQLLAQHGDEGDSPGLGWVPGRVRRFRFESGSSLRIPHMGWNHLEVKGDHGLFRGLTQESRFYFVHSFHLETPEPSIVSAVCRYGYEFAAAVKKGNIQGVQFHPEKSLKFGMRLIRNFAEEA